MISVSVIFDTGDTYGYSSNKGEFVYLEGNTLTKNLKSIDKGLYIYGFRIVKYSIRRENGEIITLRDQAHDVPGQQKYFCIIYPKVIQTPEGYKSTFVAHFHDEHSIHAYINSKEENPGWQKA